MKAVRQSPFLMALATALPALAALYFLVARIFAGAVTERFPDPEALAGFLGAFAAAALASALAVSLLAASRLFARFGVIPVVTFLPAAYAAGFALIGLAPGFAPVVAMRFVQFVWVNGVWMPGWNSLLSVVPPERRERVRLFMDGIPFQAGVAAAGLLLLAAGIDGLGWLVYASGVALGLAGLLAAWRARGPYREAVMEALREGHGSLFRDEDDPFTGLMNDPVARRVVLEAASGPEPGARRLALEVLGTGPEADSVCGRALDDGDADVRAAALRTLMRGSGPPPPQVQDLLADPDPDVRVASLEVIRLRGALPDPDFRRLMRDPSPRVRAAAAAARPSDRESLRMLSSMAGSGDPEDRAAAASALPLFDSPEELLAALIRDGDQQVRRAAASALGMLGDAGTRRLVDALDDPVAGEAALEALGPALEAAPDMLAEWAAQCAAEAVERARSAAALAAGNGAGTTFLEWVLRSSAEALAVRALRASRYAGSPEAVEMALAHVGGADPLKGAALESLETAGPPYLRFVLEVWEPAPPARPAPAVEEAARWSRSGDPILRAATALTAVGPGGRLPGALLDELRTDPDPLVREAAGLSLAPDMKTLGTLSLMERLVFLRGVHLFAELDPSDLKHVAAAMTEHSFEDGEWIARAGDPGGDMHIVVSGSIAVTGPGGESIALRNAGEHVGEMSVISGEPRSAGLVASGPVRTLSLDRATFERILRDRPATTMAVMRVLCHRLSELSGPPDWH